MAISEPNFLYIFLDISNEMTMLRKIIENLVVHIINYALMLVSNICTTRTHCLFQSNAFPYSWNSSL